MIMMIKTTLTITAKTPTEPPAIPMVMAIETGSWERAAVTTTGGSDGLGDGVLLRYRAKLWEETPFMVDMIPECCVGIDKITEGDG